MVRKDNDGDDEGLVSLSGPPTPPAPVIVRRRRRQNLGQIRVENVQRRDFLPLGPLEK